jgi:hypothetical protein
VRARLGGATARCGLRTGLPGRPGEASARAGGVEPTAAPFRIVDLLPSRSRSRSLPANLGSRTQRACVAGESEEWATHLGCRISFKNYRNRKGKCNYAESLFTRLIIHLFRLVFSIGTVFFSHNKSANSVFHPAYQPSRTGPKS